MTLGTHVIARLYSKQHRHQNKTYFQYFIYFASCPRQWQWRICYCK